jgi:division protein CdvB (Snf7/Vps24/ESCRT-III family)
MRQLENGVGAARGAVRDIEAVAHEAAELSRTTGETVGELVKGIGIVQLVRTDIHYMALNTNLRCSKIGEEGKAINVVTTELRNFAAELDQSADKILAELQVLEAAARKLNEAEGTGEQQSLDQRLEKAMANIRAVGDRMDHQMDALSDQSETAISEMDRSLARLDFNAELGDVLRACAEELAVDDIATEAPGLDEAITELGSRIARLYTMVSERELHARVLGTAAPVETPIVAAVMSDDDIDDALF